MCCTSSFTGTLLCEKPAGVVALGKQLSSRAERDNIFLVSKPSIQSLPSSFRVALSFSSIPAKPNGKAPAKSFGLRLITTNATFQQRGLVKIERFDVSYEVSIYPQGSFTKRDKMHSYVHTITGVPQKVYVDHVSLHALAVSVVNSSRVIIAQRKFAAVTTDWELFQIGSAHSENYSAHTGIGGKGFGSFNIVNRGGRVIMFASAGKKQQALPKVDLSSELRASEAETKTESEKPDADVSAEFSKLEIHAAADKVFTSLRGTNAFSHRPNVVEDDEGLDARLGVGATVAYLASDISKEAREALVTDRKTMVKFYRARIDLKAYHKIEPNRPFSKFMDLVAGVNGGLFQVLFDVTNSQDEVFVCLFKKGARKMHSINLLAAKPAYFVYLGFLRTRLEQAAVLGGENPQEQVDNLIESWKRAKLPLLEEFLLADRVKSVAEASCAALKPQDVLGSPLLEDLLVKAIEPENILASFESSLLGAFTMIRDGVATVSPQWEQFHENPFITLFICQIRLAMDGMNQEFPFRMDFSQPEFWINSGINGSLIALHSKRAETIAQIATTSFGPISTLKFNPVRDLVMPSIVVNRMCDCYAHLDNLRREYIVATQEVRKKFTKEQKPELGVALRKMADNFRKKSAKLVPAFAGLLIYPEFWFTKDERQSGAIKLETAWGSRSKVGSEKANYENWKKSEVRTNTLAKRQELVDSLANFWKEESNYKSMPKISDLKRPNSDVLLFNTSTWALGAQAIEESVVS